MDSWNEAVKQVERLEAMLEVAIDTMKLTGCNDCIAEKEKLFYPHMQVLF